MQVHSSCAADSGPRLSAGTALYHCERARKELYLFRALLFAGLIRADMQLVVLLSTAG